MADRQSSPQRPSSAFSPSRRVSVVSPAPLRRSSAKLTPKPQSSIGSREKQFRVDSDVRAGCVVENSVWLAHNDGTLSIRNAKSSEVVKTMKVENRGARAWSILSVPGASPRVWVGLSNGDIDVYDGLTKQHVHHTSRHTGGVYCLAEFNGMVYSGSNDFEIIQWSAEEMNFKRQFNGHRNYVRALHAEGAVLTSASDDQTIRIWNAVTGAVVSVLNIHKTSVSSLCRVGLHMWSGDDSGKIIIWRVSTLDVEDTLCEHHSRITTLKKVGARVYSGSSDYEIAIWDIHTRQVIGRLTDHKGWIYTIFAPSQLTRYYVWSAAADSSVKCFHHDEYKVTTADLERFDNVAWYHAEYTPYKDLNHELQRALAVADSKVEYALTQAREANEARDAARVELEELKLTARRWESALDSAQRELHDEKDVHVPHLLEMLDRKEKELAALSDEIKTLHGSNVDLRCKNETLKMENDEAVRRGGLLFVEKEKLQKALDDALLQAHAAERRASQADQSAF
jgi:hypothetical protein